MTIQKVVFAETKDKDNLIALIRTDEGDFVAFFPITLGLTPAFFYLYGSCAWAEPMFIEHFGDYVPTRRCSVRIDRYQKMYLDYPTLDYPTSVATGEDINTIQDELHSLMFDDFLQARNRFIADAKIEAIEKRIKLHEKSIAKLKAEIPKWQNLP